MRGRQIAYYYSYPWEILTAAFTGYIGLFVIGIPLVRVLRRYSRLNLLFLTAYGGIAGAVVFVFFIGIFSWSLGSQPHFDGILKLLAMLLLGGVLGASVAAAYGLIAGMPFTTKPDGKAIEHTANADSEDKVL